MATEYTQVAVRDLDIVPIYKELMEASVGQGSIYLKAKETIQDYVANGRLSEREKAEVLGKHVIDLASTLTSQSMQTALAIVKDDRDAPYALTKLREDTKAVTAGILRTEAEIKDVEGNAALKIYSGWKAQADLFWDSGITSYTLDPTVPMVPELAYDKDFGIKRQTISKAQADLYTTLATNYRQNGDIEIAGTTEVFPASSLPVGLNVLQNMAGTTATATELGLTAEQTLVAERQLKGFDDNMRQHVVNSSASMISMLLATEEAELADLVRTETLPLWTDVAQYLNGNPDYEPTVVV